MAFWNKKDKKTQAQTPTQTYAGPQLPGLKRVKNIIAIASGKGGVGKSTVSTNLAVALKQQGFSVGLLDADIYGPSQTGMLGAPHQSEFMAKDGMIVPNEKHGLKFMSMGLISKENSPVVWRAPMATKMISQFLNVNWGELDFLLIDLPPGTGDVQITLAQQASLTGAVIVSTPQKVALNITEKGLKMFEQVNVPILGVVENMSGFECGHCHEVTEVFKGGGAKEMSERVGTTFLGSLPLDPAIMMAGDDGVPVLEKNADSKAAKALIHIAQNLEKAIEDAKGKYIEPRHLDLDEAGNLKIDWQDGEKTSHEPFTLRTNCSCANCVDENTGKKILKPSQVPVDIKITGVRPVGRYGISINYSDGHNTGIYKFSRLKELNQTQESFSV